MFERTVVGSVPRKHHIQHKDAAGQLLWEECITQDGFEGPYTIAYHQHAPQRQLFAGTKHGWPKAIGVTDVPLLKRHFLTQSLQPANGPQLNTRLPLLTNADLTFGVVKPTAEDPVYFNNADGDDLFYIHEGTGTFRTNFGDLKYGPLDYVFMPRGTIYRAIPDTGVAQHWVFIELKHGLHIPSQWRNPVGQLRMDAPFCHRDFRKVEFRGPLDEGIRELVVKRHEAFHGYSLHQTPLDIVGWDGSVYPWVFPILNFQARAGLVHLPPTWHGTFATKGALICSFVPRMVDFHPEAIPCPYPHSSVDVDEILFYCKGNFISRKGVGPGSVSFHPAGIPHGPHPGAYEGSVGHKETNELAVMLDCALPLKPTAQALGIEDSKYMNSFVP